MSNKRIKEELERGMDPLSKKYEGARKYRSKPSTLILMLCFLVILAVIGFLAVSVFLPVKKDTPEVAAAKEKLVEELRSVRQGDFIVVNESNILLVVLTPEKNAVDLQCKYLFDTRDIIPIIIFKRQYESVKIVKSEEKEWNEVARRYLGVN